MSARARLLAVLAGGPLWLCSACGTPRNGAARSSAEGAPVGDRFSPAQMRQGPSLTETGHIAVPTLSGGAGIAVASTERVRSRRERARGPVMPGDGRRAGTTRPRPGGKRIKAVGAGGGRRT